MFLYFVSKRFLLNTENMKFYKLTNKYEMCIRNRSNLPYYKFWFHKSSVVNKHSKPLGYSIGVYLYFWHISIDVSLF